MESYTEKRIHIVGPLKPQNELLASFLTAETGSQCRTAGNFRDILAEDGGNAHHPSLALWDCFGKDAEACLSELDSDARPVLANDYLALFNVVAYLGIEEKAVDRGARGFLYTEEDLQQFKRCVSAIFRGELWVPRKVMSELIIKRNQNRFPGEACEHLTLREMEILQMIAAGYSNSRIAEKLFISPHTVRTHIYNIYRKIDVPSRVQAALWAVKNL